MKIDKHGYIVINIKGNDVLQQFNIIFGQNQQQKL